MFKVVRAILLLAALFVLCSCAAGVPYTQLNPSVTPEAPDTGRVFFYRPSFVGAAVQPEIVMNGKTVGKAISEGFFFLDCPPGEYEVATTTEVTRKISFVLDKGQTRYIRFNINMGFFVGHVYGELIDAEEAMPEIQKCKYIEDKKTKS